MIFQPGRSAGSDLRGANWAASPLKNLTHRLVMHLCSYAYLSHTSNIFVIYLIYSTCRWHGSCRTYPKNANSHVICKVKKTEKCISPVSSVKCLGKKNTWHGTSASKKMQNISFQLTHTLYISHPTWTKIVYECMTTYYSSWNNPKLYVSS